MTTSRHGTRARYVAGCGCSPCKSAQATYNAAHKRKALYGRPTTDLVDAGPAREHVRALMVAGMGARAIAAAAGVERKTVQILLNGRLERGTPPTRRIKPETAVALLAVTVALSDRTLIDASGARRRLQALVACGWSMSKLAARIGMAPTNLPPALGRDRVTVALARKVAGLYDELWDQAPPETTHQERQAASRARNHADARGWLRPMEQDDDLIDLTEEEFTAEVDRRVAAMDDDEMRQAWTSRYKHGERSPVIAAAAVEWSRRVKARLAA